MTNKSDKAVASFISQHTKEDSTKVRKEPWITAHAVSGKHDLHIQAEFTETERNILRTILHTDEHIPTHFAPNLYALGRRIMMAYLEDEEPGETFHSIQANFAMRIMDVAKSPTGFDPTNHADCNEMAQNLIRLLFKETGPITVVKEQGVRFGHPLHGASSMLIASKTFELPSALNHLKEIHGEEYTKDMVPHFLCLAGYLEDQPTDNLEDPIFETLIAYEDF